MKASVSWLADRTFVGATESGHSVVFGTAHEDRPKPGPGAMELILIGTGGCSAWDVVNILQKGRQAVDDVTVSLEADRADTEPKVFTRVHLHFTVTGRALDEARVRRAIVLSLEKYCSATAMVARTATVTHDFTIVETGTAAG